MGKKKSKPKGDELSKKARRKLEEREAAIAAELAERTKAAKKKDKKKSGKKAVLETAPTAAADLGVITIEPEAPIATTPEAAAPEPEPDITSKKSPHAKHLDHVGELHKIANDPKAKKKDRKIAAAALDELRAEGERLNAEKAARRASKDAESDETIKARVQAKRAARAEKAAEISRNEGETEPEYQMRRLREMREAEAIAATADAVDAIKQAVEAVETETGRIFEAGESVATAPADDFAKPSESGRREFETNGLNQYRVKRPSDGKLVGYTRVTTYIKCLEDTSRLTEWKLRVLLEGVAAAEEFSERGESATAKVRELAHVRDVAIAKAHKADRKGKLDLGELATLTGRAWSDFKKAMNTLADELFEIGGGREKATKGTDIHGLTEIYDRDGIDAVGELLTEGKISPADMADVEAYREAMLLLGGKVVEQERVIVNDDLKVAGRLDRVVLVKLPAIHDPKTGEIIRPAEARARRRVLDIKTGSLEYSAGTVAQQIEMYAGAKGYDLETHEREDLKLDRTLGLVLHLPAGSGQATIHLVDLVAGRKGNKLAGDVRAWRNEGKKAIDLHVDLLAEIKKATD